MKSGQSGVILITTFIVMAALTALAVGFLLMTSVQMKSAASDLASTQAVWLAEAGLQKVVWNLKTPVGSGGQGEDWTTTGTTESLGDGSYTLVVTRYDFALATNGATASDNPATSSPAHGPDKAVDGNDSTYWQSKNEPNDVDPQELIIAFPHPLTLNKVRFLATASNRTPKDYTWEVSTNGTDYTVVVTVTNNGATDVTNTFTAASNVNYLKLKATDADNKLRIATGEAIGAKITSTGTVASLNRKAEQTAVADDATQTAADQIDWNEIVPA